MTVGFNILAAAGEAEFHLCDHGHAERPPLVTQATVPGLRAVLMGRLYYRTELRARLGLAAGEAHNPAQDNDAALALAVYRQHGRDGLERLEGDFALVIWDAGRQCLVAMRDPMGGYPIFYAMQQGRVAVGTHMEPLLDLLPSRTLNQDYLADYLATALLTMEESADGRTVYQGVRRVLTGSIVVFHLSSGKVEDRRYWDWLEHQVDPGTDDVALLGEQYLERLQAAVRTRLRGRTASHVSGGMDSTGVALIARDCLAGREPLHALALVYDRLPYLARERPYLESALAQPGLMAHRIDGDDLLDFADFDTAPAHDEPYTWLFRLGFQNVLDAEAARVGAATVMTGLGADEMLDIRPAYLADLLRSGRLWTAWGEASRWARARSSNAWEEMRRNGLDNLMPAPMLMGLGSWLHGGYAPWGRHTQWTIAPWIQRDFAQRMDLRGRILTNIRQIHHACRPAGLSLTLWNIRQSCEDFCRMNLSAQRGMMLTHPFRDPRVYSLGLGIQARVRPQPGAQKPILAAAMRGILPECILKRPSKVHFNEVYYLGLSRNLRRMEALIEEAPLDELGFLDKGPLLDCMQRAALGNAGDAPSMSAMDRTLSLLLWLTREHRGRLTQKKPLPAPGRQGPHITTPVAA
jgi:asparagine synthase (glutamine-hydrolysing)